MAKVEGARWDDLELATTAIFQKEAAGAGAPARGPLASFDLDGSLDLVARLQKAAADEGNLAPPFRKDNEATAPDESNLAPPFKKDDEKPESDLAPPFKKKDEDEDEPEDNLAPPFKKDDGEKTAEVAAAAVIRQTLADVCHVLSGAAPSLDKTAGVIGVGLLEGHPAEDVASFLLDMEKQALDIPFSPWRNLPETGMLGRARQLVYKTPAERNLQAEGRLGRAEAKATAGLDKQLLKDETLYANRAAVQAKGDAAERVSQIRAHMQSGLSRRDAEQLIADKAAKAEKSFLARSRDAHGLDKNKIRLGVGSAGIDVNKRLFKKTAPMMLAPLAAGYLLGGGLKKKDEDRPRGITIS